jgi:lysophospholipase L1-like esterase
MNVFVIGGCHVANYGIQPHLGFVQQWVNQVKNKSDEPIHVTSLSMVRLNQVADLLSKYQPELEQADLLIMQLGHYELSWRKPFRELFQVTPHTLRATYRPKTPKAADLKPILLHEQLKNSLKSSFLTLYRCVYGQPWFMNQFAEQLADAFQSLNVYQKKVVIMTPFPTLNEVDQWLRRVGHPMIMKAANQAGFSLVDTFGVIPRKKAYFLADGVHLNRLGHLVVALRLNELPIGTECIAEEIV